MRAACRLPTPGRSPLGTPPPQVVACVIDSGVLDHEDLRVAGGWGRGCLNVPANETSSGTLSSPGARSDPGVQSDCVLPEPGTAAYSDYTGKEAWHGTHVAGILGAVGDNALGVAGVTWNVSSPGQRPLVRAALRACGGAALPCTRLPAVLAAPALRRSVQLLRQACQSTELHPRARPQVSLWSCRATAPNEQIYTSSFLDCMSLCRQKGSRVRRLPLSGRACCAGPSAVALRPPVQRWTYGTACLPACAIPAGRELQCWKDRRGGPARAGGDPSAGRSRWPVCLRGWQLGSRQRCTARECPLPAGLVQPRQSVGCGGHRRASWRWH